jgi:hypothetical protein
VGTHLVTPGLWDIRKVGVPLKVNASVDNWPIMGINLVNKTFGIVALPAARIPAGFQLTIAAHFFD